MKFLSSVLFTIALSAAINSSATRSCCGDEPTAKKSRPIESEFDKTVHCPGHYQGHLQGVCTNDKDAIYWSFTTKFVKTDLAGTIQKSIPVASHHGDLCYHDEKIYVAVNLGQFNQPAGKADSWVYVYDSESLKELAKHYVPEVVHGAGGMDYHDGRFIVVGGLPNGINENYLYEYTPDFKFTKRHVLKSGHTHLGIQTAAYIDGHWWFGCYGTPRVTLKADNEFNFLGKSEFECSLGIVGSPGGKFWIARGKREKDNGHIGWLLPAQLQKPDGPKERGLELKQITQKQAPLVRVADLNVGEQQNVTLANGKIVNVKLLKLAEKRDPIRNAVRSAKVTLQIDDESITLESGMYNLPQTVGKVQVDCSVTSGYNSNGTPAFWGLDKAARIRLWPEGSPLIKPNTFIYPVKQRWFATGTWFDNEPVDGGTSILPKIYYHSGLDIGATEKLTPIVAATDALVVSVGELVLDGHQSNQGSPVEKRYDVVYLKDSRGWYYRYSHLDSIDDDIKPGRHIDKGTMLGYVGKEGASGGWSHLHFEIKAKQPSGKWGTQAGYAFLRQAYIDQYKPKLLAHARTGQLIMASEPVTLNGNNSWVAKGNIASYEWQLSDGTTAGGPMVEHRYDKPGTYHETLKVTDDQGNVDYDFVLVKVVDPRRPKRYPPSLHAAYWPTFEIKPNDEVSFKVRGFGFEKNDNSPEVWDFGDGSPAIEVHSVGNHVHQHASDGYAITTHRYAKPGHYIVTAKRTSKAGVTAHYRLQVRVGVE